MNEISPARIGFLVDTARDPEHPYTPDMLPIFEMVAEEYAAQGLLERPVEFVVRAVEGLPRGTFRAVRDAFYELVEEDCLAIFGPYVSENTVPLREHVERTAQVPILSMAGTESMLGEWVFALNNGSMPEEPRIMAAIATFDGCGTVGIAYEASLIGEEYLYSTRASVQGVRPAHHRGGGHTPGRAREAGCDGAARATSGRTRSCTSASASASSA